MGVIRNLNNVSDPFAVLIDDVLDIIEQQAEEDHEIVRHSRRIRRREPVTPQSTGSSRFPTHKSGKRYRRAENANFLMSLADDDERSELSIYDFIPESVSAFARLLMERENMEAWNNFINQSDEDQWKILENIEQGKEIDLVEKRNDVSKTDGTQIVSQDGRSGHPAFSADECFRRIDSDLRTALKRKHVPLGTLAQLEEKITTFFKTKPHAIYKSQLQNSYDRLMVHAACQYMNLYSNSYNKGGVRWTRVRNTCHHFNPPAVSLSTYLENRVLHRNYEV